MSQSFSPLALEIPAENAVCREFVVYGSRLRAAVYEARNRFEALQAVMPSPVSQGSPTSASLSEGRGDGQRDTEYQFAVQALHAAQQSLDKAQRFTVAARPLSGYLMLSMEGEKLGILKRFGSGMLVGQRAVSINEAHAQMLALLHVQTQFGHPDGVKYSAQEWMALLLADAPVITEILDFLEELGGAEVQADPKGQALEATLLGQPSDGTTSIPRSLTELSALSAASTQG